ncbi:hypothetical protein FUAX_38310 (plasmid) [Fulvitalea axinellae]|uniref:Uncharacterized protein n=1 Tax=Fulvitalea axinellae TaxID=1182444 RepID=A0AAU9CGT1_9BACT|nr:hypothetical protein FUAX_38310 [Fulvitalea axinellae]
MFYRTAHRTTRTNTPNEGAGRSRPVQALFSADQFSTAYGPDEVALEVARKDRSCVKEIVNLLKRYARSPLGPKTEDLDSRMRMLSKLREYTHEWFTKNPVREGDKPHKTAAMFSLMDEIQKEHEEMIALTIADRRDLWVPQYGSAAFRERASEDSKRYWRYLTEGHELFKINNFPGTDPTRGSVVGFRLRMLSAFARLLESEKGRALVGGLFTRYKQPVALCPDPSLKPSHNWTSTVPPGPEAKAMGMREDQRGILTLGMPPKCMDSDTLRHGEDWIAKLEAKTEESYRPRPASTKIPQATSPEGLELGNVKEFKHKEIDEWLDVDEGAKEIREGETYVEMPVFLRLAETLMNHLYFSGMWHSTEDMPPESSYANEPDLKAWGGIHAHRIGLGLNDLRKEYDISPAKWREFIPNFH